MAKAVEVAKENFSGIRTGRANPGMFARIMVDYYGAATPLQQLASFTTPEPRTIMVAPFDVSSSAAVEKALRDSDLGVNPAMDGYVIRVVLPQLTEERRIDYVNLARSMSEYCRVSVRSVCRRAKEALEGFSKDGDAGEDEVSRAEKELEALTKRYIDQIDEGLEAKEQELLEV